MPEFKPTSTVFIDLDISLSIHVEEVFTPASIWISGFSEFNHTFGDDLTVFCLVEGKGIGNLRSAISDISESAITRLQIIWNGKWEEGDHEMGDNVAVKVLG